MELKLEKDILAGDSHLFVHGLLVHSAENTSLEAGDRFFALLVTVVVVVLVLNVIFSLRFSLGGFFARRSFRLRRTERVFRFCFSFCRHD